MIDLEAVATLSAVDRIGTVVGAAAHLGYTPSAISQQIKRLERSTGLQLLDRVGRGVVLTLEGRDLVERGSMLLAELESLETTLQHRRGDVGGTVRLASFATAVRGFVAPALTTLSHGHPHLDVRLIECDPWGAVDLVAQGQRDLAVVHSWGTTLLAIPDHVEIRPLLVDQADVIVRRDHRLASRDVVTPADLIRERWIASPEGTICFEWLQRMHDEVGGTPNVVHRATEFDTHVALVDAGCGIALVPRLGRAPLPANTIGIAVEPEPQRQVSMIVRTSMAASPAVAAIHRALLDAATRSGAGGSVEQPVAVLRGKRSRRQSSV